ncbi:MAG: DNA polymerase III subunit delta' C-terminal domain-containing protein [Verrucomicrobiota bacterium]
MAFTLESARHYAGEAVRRGRLAHAYLVTGPAGSGKESLAGELVRQLNGGVGESLDALSSGLVRVVRPSSKSRLVTVQQVRELERTLRVQAPRGKTKVAVLVEAERLGEGAANAFLKTLEEPPPQSLLLLLTEAPEQLLDTIRSRCLQVSLQSREIQRSEEEQEMVALLAGHFQEGRDSVAGALRLLRRVSQLLDGVRAEIQKQADSQLEAEKATYQKTTEGDWLKRREETWKALAASSYLRERTRLFDLFLGWFADAVRQQVGVSIGLEFPEQAAVSAALAGRYSLQELMEKMEAVEALREQLQSNAQETLSLEAGFLKIFG